MYTIHYFLVKSCVDSTLNCSFPFVSYLVLYSARDKDACIRSGNIGAVVVAVIYGILFDTRDVILSDPMSLNFQDYLNFILLAAFGLLGFLLLTR